MVAFRKLLPVLAILGMLIGLTSTASAQGNVAPLVCQANAGVPPLVRAEGYTELVGDVVLSCTGGNPATPFLANFQLFLNTNITSRLIASGVSEATLLIDEPGTTPTGGTLRPFCTAPSPTSGVTGTTNSTNGVTGGIVGATNTGSPCTGSPYVAGSAFQTGTYNTFVANTTSQPNAVVWPGIPVIPPGSTGTRTFHFTNVRANAAGLGTSNTLIPTQIIAFISVSGSQSLAVNNPQQIVAYIQQGLQFAVRNCTSSDVPGSATAFAQCTNFGGNLRTDPTATNDAPFGLRFREGFQTAFKPRIAIGQSASIPGVSYNSESGFVLGSAGATGTIAAPFLGDVQGSPGVASSGTRLAARFANIPAGVRLYVTTNSVAQGTTTASQAAAILVNADANGAGGTILTSGSATPLTGVTATATLTCAGVRPSTIGGGTGANAVELTVVNGSAVATWEIVGSDPSIIEDAFFLVAVAATANTANNLPGLGTSTVTGNFAPFYAASTGANTASASLPVPRFIDNPITTNDFTISSCQTNLLFPFVTNQAGFDTGIAISNTSRDPFASASSRLQGGRCTINYYGNTTNGGAAPAAQTTTANVDPGAQLTFVLSSGGNLGVAGTPGFQGYIIAQCNFRYAHGFAFVTDGPIGQARVAEGYLALILDDAIAPSRTGSASESLSN